MNITQLIASLQDWRERLGDVEVQVTWEGITRKLQEDRLWESKSGLLFIDADENFYKERLGK